MNQETECGCGQHGHGQQHGMGHAHGECSGHHGYPIGIRQHHSSGGDCDCNCGCGDHHGGGLIHRRFISKEEIINQMEDYLMQLRAEATGVEERIAEIKKGQA
jgi:hypothetical protein